MLKQRSLNFQLARRDRSSLLTYKPNNTYNLGLGVYLFELGLEFSFAIPLREQSIERYGESSARDLILFRQRILRLLKDPDKILLRQVIQFHPNGKASLKFRYQV